MGLPVHHDAPPLVVLLIGVISSALRLESVTVNVTNIIIGSIFGEPTEAARSNEVAYEVRPAVDFDKLRTVWVVMPNDDEAN